MMKSTLIAIFFASAAAIFAMPGSIQAQETAPAVQTEAQSPLR